VNWLVDLSSAQPEAHAVLVLAAIAVVGLALASVKVRGVGLGVAGVLFAGILVGHFGGAIDPDILAFVREFGLILFVFTIGLQLGPGFFASLRKEGVRLNALAAVVVVLGVGMTMVVAAGLKIDILAALGLYSGATTNTPSLGAAQQTLRSLPHLSADQGALPALAYAAGYPIGILGTIAALLLVRGVFRINAEQEAAAFKTEQHKGIAPLERMNLVVENPALDKVPIADVPGRREAGVVISRIKPAGETAARIAADDTVLRLGDIVLVVGTRRDLERFRLVVGRPSDVDLRKAPGRVTDRRIVVTHKRVLGKTLEELGLSDLYGVAVTRVNRATIEMTAVPDLRLQFGDMLVVVGEEESLDKVAEVVGNSFTAMNETNFIPIFVGIALGVLVGSLPICVPGMPAPLRLGLAGGPLVLAILLSRIGRIGPLVCYMPGNANVAFRQLGIILFLACVGLKAGENFFRTVLSDVGLAWLAGAACITMVPLALVGVLARGIFKLNYVTICGLISGSMTDPPALAFANAISKSDAPSVAYATVYPLTMLLRIVTAEAMVLLWCR
jgi:putative transport protein